MTVARARMLAGVLIALGVGVVLVFATLNTASTQGRTVTWVYRVDTQAGDGTQVGDGTWDVREWGVAHGPRRATVLQTHLRACRRQAPAHVCRATVEATFTDLVRARDRRRTLCQQYVRTSGHRPAAMPSC